MSEECFYKKEVEDLDQTLPVFIVEQYLQGDVDLGDYTLDKVIDETSMSLVVRAKKDDKICTMKIPKVHKQSLIERLETEKKALERCSHQNIVRLLDSSENPPYLVLEYLHGKPLSRYSGNEHHQKEFAYDFIELAAQAALALEHMHSKNIIHRDIKPGNLLNTPEGIKIIDFGVSLIDREDDPDYLLGTPAYMAPEQAMDPSKVGPCSDIYSLGLTLNELIIGKRALPECQITPQKIKAWAEEIPPEDPSKNPAIGPLAPIIKKAYNPDPEKRYQSALDFYNALSTILEIAERRGWVRGQLLDSKDWPYEDNSTIPDNCKTAYLARTQATTKQDHHSLMRNYNHRTKDL